MTNGNRTTVAIIAGASMFCFAAAAAVAIVYAVPNDATAGTLIALLFAALSTGIPAVIGTAKAYQVEARQQDVASDIKKIRNGEMDAKLRAAVAEVLAPHLIDPAAEPQLREDRATRDRADLETREDQP